MSAFVTISCAQPPLKVIASLGATPPVPAGGYGGWNLISRPRRKALTQFDGIDPLRILVPIILGVKPGTRHGGLADGFVTNTSAEHDRNVLEKMAQPTAVGAEPPQIRIQGPVPHATDGPWVIEGFDFDPTPVYSASGYIVRQAVTIHLLEYIRDDQLADLNAAAHARQTATTTSQAKARAAGGTSNQAPKAKIYVVRVGDTLSAIAARVLGNAKRWTEIASLNSIRDPNKITVGQKLRLP